VAVDATDFATRETGLAATSPETFKVYRARNGAAAAQMTTPTIAEVDATNMPGVYSLLLDEDMTIGAGNDSEEMVFHITATGMAPVTRTIELYRPKITAGNTLGVAADGDISGNLDGTVATVTTLTGHTAQTGDTYALANGAAGFVAIDTVVDAIKVVTDAQAATGTGLTAIPWNAAWDAEVQSEVADALTAFWTSPATLVDLVWDEPLTAGTHNVANSSGKRVRELQESGAVYGGYIWIDTVNGSAGTDSYVNGTSDNPVDTIGDANTLAAALGIARFKVAPGSSITFAATQSNQAFEGEAWTLALGGQNIDGSTFKGASVSGIGTNTADSQFFYDCLVTGATTIPGDTHLVGCGVGATITLGEPGDYFIDNCHSAIAGSGSPTLDFGSPATETNLSVRHHSGGWTIANMGAGAGTCNASFEGDGQITWAASCAATSNASVRGNWKITDLASGAVTETLDDNQTGVDAILVDTADMQPKLGTPAGADMSADIADIPTVAEFEVRTPTAAQLAYIVSNAATGLPVTFTTSGGSTTAAVLNQVDGAGASSTNDQYNGRLLVFTDGTLKGVVTDITDYDGGTTTATITAIPTAPTASHNARLI
jgi:hypothetical protein